jgi:hypothetical protein
MLRSYVAKAIQTAKAPALHLFEFQTARPALRQKLGIVR